MPKVIRNLIMLMRKKNLSGPVMQRGRAGVTHVPGAAFDVNGPHHKGSTSTTPPAPSGGATDASGNPTP